MLLAIPAIWEGIEELTESEVTFRSDVTAADAGVVPPTESIWKALIAAEEATLPEVEIAGPTTWDVSTFSRIRVHIPRPENPWIMILRTQSRFSKRSTRAFSGIGELNTRETKRLFID